MSLAVVLGDTNGILIVPYPAFLHFRSRRYSLFHFDYLSTLSPCRPVPLARHAVTQRCLAFVGPFLPANLDALFDCLTSGMD